jgi:ABC-type sugar transport system ATPase subunit
LVEVVGVTKRFGGVVALDDVSLEIGQAEIHGFAGENGAGKSTLGRILAGALRPDHGELRVGGTRRSYSSPRDAIADGVTMIAQEPTLVPTRSVAENVFLGHESTTSGFLRRRELAARFAELNQRTGFGLDPGQPVRTLRVADQQKVEILRAVSRDARLIVMDEPTAPLTFKESEQLYQVMRDLRSSGLSLIYVSHFLTELVGLCDRVTVLKDGRHVQTTDAAGETPSSLVSAMLGRSFDAPFPKIGRSPSGEDPIFEVNGLTRDGVIDDISFSIRAGEIVGMTGLLGSGRTEIARAIFGADRPDAGEIRIDGEPVRIKHPADAIANGIAMLPESRKDQGLVLARGVRDNLTLTRLRHWSRFGFLRLREEREAVDGLIADLSIKTPRASTPVWALSGGNQQKVLFGKSLVCRPRVLIVDEPTRGVDVGAKRAIYDLIAGLAAEGTAVLVISSELEEVQGLAHRILVVRAGRIAQVFDRGVSERDLLSAAFGEVPATATLAVV